MSFIMRPSRFAASGGTSLLLDTYTGAAAAYSLRKLRTAYSGSAIRVRRSSDSAEQDIGFTSGGDLDESALTTFVGAGDGFVTTWYDQSGSAIDLSQATVASQPKIVSSGSVETKNSKPCVSFDGSNHFIEAISTLYRAFPYSWFLVGSRNGSVNGALVTLVDASVNNKVYGLRFFDTPDSVQIIARNTSFYTGTVNVASSDVVVSGRFLSETSRKLNVNNLSGIEDTISVTQSTDMDTFTLGRFSDSTPGGYLNGAIQEFVGYELNKESDESSIRSALNSYWSVY
jgi:hypothetical protein